MGKIWSLVIGLLFCTTLAAQNATQITWFGHAAFEITTPKGLVLMIDPWLTNPMNPDKDKAVKAVKRLDYILLTHGHFDHVGDTVALAKQTKARLVANYELGTNMARVLGYPAEQMGFDTLMNSGGEIKLGDGEVTVAMTPAMHSSSLDPAHDKNKQAPLVYAGNANGFVIQIQHGPTIYHTGDTALFEDMRQIRRYRPNLALINIGGHFGMEPSQALACAKLVGAKHVIPHHFQTFPILTPDASSFLTQLKHAGLHGRVLPIGQTVRLNAKGQWQ